LTGTAHVYTQTGARFLPFKPRCLKDTFRNAFQATNSCAFAYSYARIRRLVRLGGGFYCGSVADESAIGFSSSATFKVREYRHYVMAALRGALRCAGILEPGLLTRVQAATSSFSSEG
jgi:hypothetical protein